MTTDVELALSPAVTYERLTRARTSGDAAAVAGRLALALLIIGTSVAVTATDRVSLVLVVTIGLSWSFAVAVQAVAAAAVILPARARTVTAPRAFELWFQAHVPWSLWFLLSPVFFAIVGFRIPDKILVATALVPLVWTGALLNAFARRVLGSPRPAVVTAVHQTVLWGLALCYAAFAFGGWDRVLDEIGL